MSEDPYSFWEQYAEIVIPGKPMVLYFSPLTALPVFPKPGINSCQQHLALLTWCPRQFW